MFSVATLQTLLSAAVPDLESLAWAAVPAIAYFGALPLYSRCAPTPPKPIERSVKLQSHLAIAATPIANLALAFLLFEHTATTLLRPSRVLAAMLVIDTVEYWSHRLLHSRVLYNHLHCVHHSIGVPHPTLSFVNHVVEIVFTTPPIVLGMLVCGCSYHEYIVSTALAFVATIADHVAVHPRAFHVMHHCGNKSHNLQQPFFTFWDHVCGTYDARSRCKIPFVP
jgi:sterol desaturase/sphingolipid hydroxylase (fatty acid hydroxylase superfamily)